MPSDRKIKLSELLVQRGLATSVTQAERIIIAGDVRSGSEVLTRPAMLVFPSEEIEIQNGGKYVSRGGEKLAGALEDFSFDVSGLRCLDVGASTGGFTDCLLQNHAQSVVAVDVAYGQFAWQLRNDERVKLLERSNIRSVEPQDIAAPFDLVVADVSFSSLRNLFSVFTRFQESGGALIALVKPQFELGFEFTGKKGVIVDAHLHTLAITRVLEAAPQNGYIATPRTSALPARRSAGNPSRPHKATRAQGQY